VAKYVVSFAVILILGAFIAERRVVGGEKGHGRIGRQRGCGAGGTHHGSHLSIHG
jgi:hypothetical protein